MKLVINSEADMEMLGADLADAMMTRKANGMVMYLNGPLGAGKTTLVRGFIRALGIKQPVKSPTYTLVESYELNACIIHHFDLYRLADPEELEYIGVRDYFTAETICLIEWPDRGAGCLPSADIIIQIDYLPPGRVLALSANTPAGKEILNEVKNRQNFVISSS